MAELYTKSNAYKNERRNKAKILTREALFVNEYVQTKYKDIYNEAAEMYNRLNKQYDKKPDLRKTLEFRIWKNQIAASKGQPVTYIPRPKMYTYNRTQYGDMIIAPPVEKPKEKTNIPNLLTASLNIPLITLPRCDTANGTVTVMQEGDQPATPVSREEDLDIEPFITDELTPEIMTQIINDLQADPAIQDLMGSIEEVLEQGIPDLEIDLGLPELDDRLEEEMMCW